MVKNGILNIMKYIFFSALVFLLSFSFAKVVCFALPSNVHEPYLEYSNGNFLYFDVPEGSNLYLISANETQYYCCSDVNNLRAVSHFVNSYGVKIGSDTFYDFTIPVGNVLGVDYYRATNYNGFWLKDDFVFHGFIDPYNPPGGFIQDLYNFNCSVSFVSSQYQSGALFTVYGANEVFDTLDYIDLKIEGNGSVTHSLHFNNFLVGANVPGLGFAYTYVFDPSAYLNEDGVFWWSARGFDSDGNWGVDYGGACNFNQTLSIVPGSSEFIKPSSPGGQIMEGIQHQSTYKITNNNSGSISSAITTGSKINDYEYYAYDIQEGDTENFNDVVNNDYSSTNTYKDYNFDFGDINIDTGEGTNFGFDSLKSFFNGEFKGRSANVVSWFQNIFPFFPSEFLNTIAWIIGIFLALVVILIAIKVIGLIL